MQTHSETWSRIVANGDFRLETVAVIDGVEYSTITAPVITNGLLPDKTLSVGNCISGTLEFSVMTNDIIGKSARVVIKGRVTDETTYSEWLEFGTFWVDHRTVDESLDEKITTLTCFDAMLKGNQPYVDTSQAMEWPKPMTTVVNRIAEQMGVQLDSRTVIKTSSDYVIYKPDSETTLLDILSWIGGVHGGNWTITQQNKLRLVPIVSAPDETFYVIDEYRRRITTPEGDHIAWKHGSGSELHGMDYIDVPVILGDVTTSDSPQADEETESMDLGEYTLISGTYNSSAAATYFQGIVGHGVDAQKVSNNYYSNGSGNIVVFRYNVPFDLPTGTNINRVYMEVNGHAESASNANEYMCVRLVSGNTYLSDEYNFKDSGTSNTTVTLECNTIPTVEQLASMQIECRLGYYGGAINGATVYVEYAESGAQVVTGVMINVDSETTYSAGNSTGIVLTLSNPNGTQNLCDDLYSEVDGIKYVPFNMTKAVYDPTVELGDLLYAGSLVQSVIYKTIQTYDIEFTADVSAPGEKELDSEYPYRSPTQKLQYTLEALKGDTVEMKSEIRQTQSSITAEVTRATGAENELSSRLTIAENAITTKVTSGQVESIIEQKADSIRLKADKISWSSTNSSMTADGKLTCTGANIKGTIESSSGNNKAVLSNAELAFYMSSTLVGRIDIDTFSGGIHMCGNDTSEYIGINSYGIHFVSRRIWVSQSDTDLPADGYSGVINGAEYINGICVGWG